MKGDGPVTGTVTFTQKSKNGPVTVIGDLKNLDPLASRGFHIQSVQRAHSVEKENSYAFFRSQLGDATNGCLSSGPHFNPYSKNHGAPSDTERHVGDLGNIKTDETGAATFTLEDSLLSLNGPLSIVGCVFCDMYHILFAYPNSFASRSVVVHAVRPFHPCMRQAHVLCSRVPMISEREIMTSLSKPETQEHEQPVVS